MQAIQEKVSASKDTRHLCEVMFSLIWHTCLAPLPSSQLTSRPGTGRPITTIYLIWRRFDTMTVPNGSAQWECPMGVRNGSAQWECPTGATLRYFHKQPRWLPRMWHLFSWSDGCIQWRPEAFWSALVNNNSTSGSELRGQTVAHLQIGLRLSG